MRIVLISLALILLFNFNSIAQKKATSDFSKEYIDWQHKDYKASKITGISTDKLYQEVINGKPSSKTVVVAIIDSGVDIEHEDFEDQIWVNTKEIPGNNIDDDNNGYIDDIHGWNFIGNLNGDHLNRTTLELTRTYAALSKKYSSSKGDDSEEYKFYKKVKKDYDFKYKKESVSLKNLNRFLSEYLLTDSIARHFLKKDTLTYKDVQSAISYDSRIQTAIDHQKSLLKRDFNIKSFKEYIKHVEDNINFYYNLNFTPRQEIIKDDLSDVNDTKYGNNDVKGPRPDHGTMVAGLVAAKRDNELGIDGIANNVKIMALRTVPDGDEYDKDVALSIRYAADNGAQIINMSFGKAYSPEKEMVWEAMQYAASKNVLMIKAAGNEALNIDQFIHYPTAYMPEQKIENVITVGASGSKRKKYLPAVFSNYGSESVDLFAPGVDLVSVYPENSYDMASGTSFASPVVTGVAALIWSHFPNLTANELKSILIESAVNYGKRKVYKPGKGRSMQEKIRFKELSKSGSIVNAYSAFQLALEKQKTVQN